MDWDVPAKYGLDVFLRREVLRWDDDKLKFAQSAKDGTAVRFSTSLSFLKSRPAGDVVCGHGVTIEFKAQTCFL